MHTVNTLGLVVSHLKAGETEAARQLVLQQLRADIDDEWAWYLLSYCVQERGEKEYALNQALRINPHNHKAAARLSAIREPKSALESTTLESFPIKVSRVESLTEAESLLEAGDLDSARTALKRILHSDPENAQAWYLLSEASQTRREQQVYLHQALRVDRGHPEATQRLLQLQAKGESGLLTPAILEVPKSSRIATFLTFGKYTTKRVLTLFLTVVVGLYLTILVANMGGYVDELFKGIIAERMMAFGFGPAIRDIPEDEREDYLAEVQWNLEEEMGLHEPFFTRTVRWLVYGLTLNFGESYLYYFFGAVMRGAQEPVRNMVFQHLPYTLVLIGASNVLLFITSVSAALVLSRKYGSWMDRISAALASLSSAPSWIFGIILILVLAGKLRVLPFPKVIDLEYADFSFRFFRLLLTQMIMPVMAIFLSIFFQGVYAWRTFFLIYSQEDYVEMAKSMGLSNRKIERQYILKPTFPYVITNFAMLMITVWESSIALEILFYWPGIGPLFLNAVRAYRTSIILGVVVVFAYLLAFTVLILDFVYAIVDPRIRLSSGNKVLKAARRKLSLVGRVESGVVAIGDFFRGIGVGLLSFLAFFKIPWSYHLGTLKRLGQSLRSTFREIRKYPSAIVGLVIIIMLIVVSIYTVIAIPYQQAISLWTPHNITEGDLVWTKLPQNASPVWTNFFRKDKLPENIQLSTTTGQVSKSYESIGESMTEITMPFTFEYPYDNYPTEISLFFTSQYERKLPHITLTWLTPDGREIQLDSFSLERETYYRLSQEQRLTRKLGGNSPNIGLFMDPESAQGLPLKGTYTLLVSGIVFEDGADIDCEYILYGRVFGLAGTDNYRRDLMVALLWGTPVALAFGLFGAVGTSLIAMIISAIGVWYGGWVDGLIQRITEVNIILPTLPIAIMIFILYSRSIWTVLLVIVLLNIFGSAIKNYRAAFIQVKESAYVEGAIAYGAKGGRIIIHYLIPRVMPVLLPQLVIMVPGFVYYEATLAYLGLSDPFLPTWGKVVHDAITSGAYQGYYYWILEPVGLLLVTGLAFALLGFALDRVINPRLRGV